MTSTCTKMIRLDHYAENGHATTMYLPFAHIANIEVQTHNEIGLRWMFFRMSTGRIIVTSVDAGAVEGTLLALIGQQDEIIQFEVKEFLSKDQMKTMWGDEL